MRLRFVGGGEGDVSNYYLNFTDVSDMGCCHLGELCGGAATVADFHSHEIHAAGRRRQKTKEQTMNLSDIATLFPHDMLTAAAIILGGGIIAVTLYTYVSDYTARYKRN